MSVRLWAAIALLGCASSAMACGEERWPVKVAVDRDVGRIDPTPVSATVFDLTQIQEPSNPSIRKDSRYALTETQVYRVSGVITLVKREDDEDYHLVIMDGKGRTMIVESASPDCAANSPYRQQIERVRRTLDQRFGPFGGKLSPQIRATVTGIGFFDRKHNQSGMAPNGIELHPMLDVRFERFE